MPNGDNDSAVISKKPASFDFNSAFDNTAVKTSKSSVPTDEFDFNSAFDNVVKKKESGTSSLTESTSAQNEGTDNSQSQLPSSNDGGDNGKSVLGKLANATTFQSRKPTTYSGVYKSAKDLIDTHFSSINPTEAAIKSDALQHLQNNNTEGIVNAGNTIISGLKKQKDKLAAGTDNGGFFSTLVRSVFNPQIDVSKQQVKDIDDKISETYNTFKAATALSIVNNKTFKNSIAAETTPTKGAHLVKSNVAKDIGAEIKKYYPLSSSTGNEDYDLSQEGLDALRTTYQLQANDLGEQAIKNNDTELAKQAHEKQNIADKYNDYSKNLVDNFPDIGTKMAQQIIRPVVNHLFPNKIFHSQQEIEKAVELIGVEQPDFAKKFGKYIAPIEDEGIAGDNWFVKLNNAVKQVPKALYNASLQVAEDKGSLVNIAEDILRKPFTLMGANINDLSDEMAKIKEKNPKGYENAIGLHQSPSKVIYDKERKMYREIPDENYGTLNLNNSIYGLVKTIPSLVDFIAKAEVGGELAQGLTTGLSAISKAAKVASYGKEGLQYYELGGKTMAEGTKHFLGTTLAVQAGDYDRNKKFIDDAMPNASELEKQINTFNLSGITAAAFGAMEVNPNEYFKSSFTNIIKDDIIKLPKNEAGYLYETDAKNLFKNVVIPKLNQIAQNVGGNFGSSAKLGATIVAADKAKQMYENYINKSKAENTTIEQDLENFATTTLSFGALSSIGGISAGLESPTQRDAIYKYGLQYPENISKIKAARENGDMGDDEANRHISLLKTLGDEVYKAQGLTNDKGLKLTQSQKQNIALENFRKRVANNEVLKGNDVENNKKIVEQSNKKVSEILAKNMHEDLHDTNAFQTASEVDENGNEIGKPKDISEIKPNSLYKYEHNGQDVVTDGTELLLTIPNSQNHAQVENNKSEAAKIEKAQNDLSQVVHSKNSEITEDDKIKFGTLVNSQLSHSFDDEGNPLPPEPLNANDQTFYENIISKATETPRAEPTQEEIINEVTDAEQQEITDDYTKTQEILNRAKERLLNKPLDGKPKVSVILPSTNERQIVTVGEKPQPEKITQPTGDIVENKYSILNDESLIHSIELGKEKGILPEVTAGEVGNGKFVPVIKIGNLSHTWTAKSFESPQDAIDFMNKQLGANDSNKLLQSDKPTGDIATTQTEVKKEPTKPQSINKDNSVSSNGEGDVKSTTKALDEIAKDNPKAIYNIGKPSFKENVLDNYFKDEGADTQNRFKKFVKDIYDLIKEQNGYRIGFGMKSIDAEKYLPETKLLSDAHRENVLLQGRFYNNAVSALNEMGFDFQRPDNWFQGDATQIHSTPFSVAEKYHKAKADGSNPELVKAVEDALATNPKENTLTKTELPKAQDKNVSGSVDEKNSAKISIDKYQTTKKSGQHWRASIEDGKDLYYINYTFKDGELKFESARKRIYEANMEDIVSEKPISKDEIPKHFIDNFEDKIKEQKAKGKYEIPSKNVSGSVVDKGSVSNVLHDENVSPQTFYHGSDNKIDKLEKRKSKTGAFGLPYEILKQEPQERGYVFLSNSHEFAKQFGDVVNEFHLPKDIKIFKPKEASEAELKYILGDAKNRIGESGGVHWNEIDFSENPTTAKEIQKRLIEKGYDGILVDEGEQGVSVESSTAIINPEKIISAKETQLSYNEIKQTIEELNKEREQKINEASKPELKLSFISNKDLVKAEDPIAAKNKHDEIKNKFKELKKLLPCIEA